MKQQTRVLSLLLALLMLFSFTAAAAEALTVTATYNGAELEGATVPAGSDIALTFSNNVTDESVLAGNISKIKVKDAEDKDVSVTVSVSDKNTFLVTLGADLAKGSYKLTIGKELTAKNGLKLGTKFECAFNVKGTGTGTGGGNNPLEIDSVTVNGNPLEGAQISTEDVIVIRFTRGMTDNFSDNADLVRVLREDGSYASYAVIAPQTREGDDNWKREYTVELHPSLESGNYKLFLGADIKANNGNTLGKDVTITFSIKAPEKQLTILERIKLFFDNLFEKIVSWFINAVPLSALDSFFATVKDLFSRLFAK